MTAQKGRKTGTKSKISNTAKLKRNIEIASLIIELTECSSQEIQEAIEFLKREDSQDAIEKFYLFSSSGQYNYTIDTDKNSNLKTREPKKHELISRFQHQLRQKQILIEDQDILGLILKITEDTLKSKSVTRSKLINTLIDLLKELDYTDINKIHKQVSQNSDSQESGFIQLATSIIEGGTSQNNQTIVTDQNKETTENTETLLENQEQNIKEKKIDSEK